MRRSKEKMRRSKEKSEKLKGKRLLGWDGESPQRQNLDLWMNVTQCHTVQVDKDLDKPSSVLLADSCRVELLNSGSCNSMFGTSGQRITERVRAHVKSIM